MHTRTRFPLRTLSLVAAIAVAAAGLVAQSRPPQPVPLPSPGLPLTMFSTDDFAGSGVCAQCHGGLRDATGQDVSIDAHWRSSMMANSSKDPLWRAKVSAEVARHPELRSVIEDKCATCHTPMARTQAVVAGVPVRLLDDGFFSASHPLHEPARDGVSCTLCHQVTPQGLGTPESFTGHYHLDTSTVPPNRVAYGPFAAPAINPMRNMSGFTPVEGAHVRGAELCATCHTLYTPTVDATGAVVGQLPEQTPYLEWKHSAYGDAAGEDRSCQQCHMPAAAGPARLANRPPWIAPRSPFAQHWFVGANAFMQGVLEGAVDRLGLTVSSLLLTDARTRTVDHLQTRTARVSIADAWIEDRTVTAAVKVESLVGHKFPTGFPSRRAWLHVTLTDADGRVVFESGRPGTDGSIAGNAADESAAGVEPHYQTITAADQVQIYEAIMADTDGRATYTLLRGAAYVKDNRLLPVGFEPATAHADVGVYGAARFDRDFSGGRDEITYSVDIPPAHGNLTITVRLLYQPVSYRFVRDLRGTETPEVATYMALHDAADHTPTAIATATAAVRQP